jgi:murein L,D-transpeptidase YcbB/YkuD
VGSRSHLFASLVFVSATVIGCASPRPHEIAEALQPLLSDNAIAPVSSAVWADVGRFYAQTSRVPVWVNHRGATARGATAIDVLRSAPKHGLEPEDYGLDKLLNADKHIKDTDTRGAERLREIAELEIRITAALLAIGRDVALGRPELSQTIPDWKPQRKSPDFVASLNTAVKGDLKSWLDVIRPKHPEYAALQKALADLREKGEQDDAQLRQVALNLNRWRLLPDDLGERHFMVNIPQYELMAREHGKPVLNIRVIVGSDDNRTPIFGKEMETVVFSPYWNIPESIAGNETAPAIARDPGYLDKQGIDVLRVSRRGTEIVDSSEVDFSDPETVKDLVFRQRPGPRNALGFVKFLFPNPYNVYLHDTPSDRLFTRQRRALSHGCIRVEEPERLARYVLRDQPEWDGPRIAEAMASGVEKHVRLRDKIPVHIVYFTATVDEGGALRFLPDIYSYDKIALR